MITYKLFSYRGKDVSVTKFVDNKFALSIPFDETNTDYQEYLEWVAEGNEPEKADEARLDALEKKLKGR